MPSFYKQNCCRLLLFLKVGSTKKSIGELEDLSNKVKKPCIGELVIFHEVILSLLFINKLRNGLFKMLQGDTSFFLVENLSYASNMITFYWAITTIMVSIYNYYSTK